jgi:CobQ-like glutamine amidotransferase family enzyme
VHGPLLPKNAWLADWLIAQALALEPSALSPLDDAFENAAHASALHAAGL